MVDISNPSPRVAIVTAAAGEVGGAIALRLAADGLNVAIIDSDSPGNEEALKSLAREIEGKGRRAAVYVGAMFKEGDVRRAFDATVAEFGKLDVMVVNDGIGQANPILSMSPEEWDEVQKINVRSIFLCYKAAAKQMVAQGRGGQIIAAGSVTGKQGAAEFSAHSASKFAVRGLTQSAAKEWWSHGITVNTFAPGAIDIPKFHAVERKEKERGNPQTFPKVSPADIAGLVSYLASEEAKYVTGQSYNINGNMYFD